MQFSYSAINKEGTTEKDQIEAASYKMAIDMLHQRGLIPTEVKERKALVGGASFAMKFSGVKLQDKILFINNLSIMLKAGVSLTKGLKILAKQTLNKKFKLILEDVSSKVESGKSFAEALELHKDVFTNIFISMVKVGELSGNLDKSLEYLAVQLQREHDMISKTKGAMMYPAVVVGAIVIVGLLMAVFVLPNLLSIFKEQNVTLPLSTRIIIALVGLISGHPILIFGGLLILVGGVIAIYRTPAGSNAFDIALLKTPIIGEISKKINMARFCRIMNSMLKSGTPILEGLQVAADSMGNIEYKRAIVQSVGDVRIGKTMSASMATHPKLFSYLVTQMIGVGEESGNVEAILEELAGHFEVEVDDTMRNLSSIIEPVLILVIGALVGILAVSLIGPIYSISTNAGG